MSPSNAFLALNVLVFGGFGIAGVFAPLAVLSGAGVFLQPDSSSIDLRAIYGGASIGFAIFVMLCMGGTRVRTGLAAVFCLTGGTLLGRLYGFVVDTGPPLMWQLAIIEVLWTAFAGWLWLRYPRMVSRHA